MRFLHFLSRAGRKVIAHPVEAWLSARMAVWVCVLSLAVKARPLPSALRMLSARTKPPTGRSRQEIEEALVRAVDPLLATGLLCFRPICWKRAAILHRYLALNGITTRIVFGMKKAADGTLTGHAWLEADGMPILESIAPDYTVTYTFPSRDQFNINLASVVGS